MVLAARKAFKGCEFLLIVRKQRIVNSYSDEPGSTVDMRSVRVSLEWPLLQDWMTRAPCHWSRIVSGHYLHHQWLFSMIDCISDKANFLSSFESVSLQHASERWIHAASQWQRWAQSKQNEDRPKLRRCAGASWALFSRASNLSANHDIRTFPVHLFQNIRSAVSTRQSRHGENEVQRTRIGGLFSSASTDWTILGGSQWGRGDGSTTDFFSLIL